MKYKVFLLTAVFIASLCAVFLLSGEVFAENGKFLTLKTTNNPDYYAVFTCDGNTISAKGVFAENLPVGIGFINGGEASMNFTAKKDGSFTASVSKNRIFDEEEKIYIELASGAKIYYLVRWDDGWYFPDNGLSELNYAKFDKIVTAVPQASAYYLSADADQKEIEATVKRLSEIAAEVTEGVDDPYKQAELICTWVAKNVYYDHDAAEAGITIETVAIANVLDVKRTVCSGFANTYCALLETLGIKSVNIKGSVSNWEYPYDELLTNVENHEFTAFWYEKESRWVYVDSCWCGSSNYADGIYSEGASDLQYFDITGEALSLNHRADKIEQRAYLEAAAPSETKTEESTEASTEASAQTSTSADETTVTSSATEATSETTLYSIVTLPPEDGEKSFFSQTGLVVAIVIFSVGIIALAVFLIINKRSGKSK